MANFSFVALDVETATGKRSSICEIGIAVIEDSEIKESKSWLIQPDGNVYWRRNIDIHGITPSDTQDKPTISEIWKEILPYIENRTIVAHNTAFDMFMFHYSNVKDAISQFHEPNKLGSQSDFRLFSFQNKLKRARLIIEQLLKEENDNFFAVEAKYNKLSMELYYNDTTDYIENCE